MSEGPDHRLERMIFFSDAVFAIAITLLVIEIHPPHLTSNDPRVGLAELGQLWPSFAAFGLSFAVIGRFWTGHHGALAGMIRFDPMLMFPNMALLACIAFMPFATAFLAANIGLIVSAVFYNAMLLLTALCSMRVVFIATSTRRGNSRHTPLERRNLRLRGMLVAFAAAAATALAFVTPPYSQLALLLVPFWRLIRRTVRETE